MSYSRIGVQKPDDLNHVRFCRDCKAQFIFVADVENHTIETGHSKMTKMSFSQFEGSTDRDMLTR
jgi:hypothetical protein